MPALRRYFGLALTLLLSCAGVSAQNASVSALSSAAFYYGEQPPLSDLQAFDIAVVEPDHVRHPAQRSRSGDSGRHELFAYVSLGEVHSTRDYYKQLPAGSLRTENAAWSSSVIDQAAPGWSEFFLSHIIAPLWEKGWRGFFLDTLDSYQLFAKTEAERKVQVDAMVATLREFKRRYPDAKLILNRGFEMLPEIAPLTYAVAAESLYSRYDAGRRQYGAVPENDRAWLLAHMELVRDQYHLPVISIDYVDPAKPNARELARATARKIAAHGFIPWVADGGLGSIGVSNIETIPRTVMVLLDVPAGEDLHTTEAQRFLGIHLNYLGLRYEFVDLASEPLPQKILAGRYAGVVTWFAGGAYHPELLPWLKKRKDEGVPVAILSKLGFQLSPAAATQLGLTAFTTGKPDKLTVVSSDQEMIGFETPPRPDRTEIDFLRLANASDKSLLRLQDGRGNIYDAAAITPWGGFALSPFVVASIPGTEQSFWVLQPQKFLRAALRLPEMPVPDVTTEGGRRILMSHVDGDGFASRAEVPGTPLSVQVLQKEIWEKYQIPVTISVIEGEISPKGVYPQLSAQTEALARKLFQLPYVEPASHTYSHPFSWRDAMDPARAAVAQSPGEEEAHRLDVPGYVFDLQREIQGSMEYVNTLLSGGKKAEVLLWSGNCEPLPAAIAQTYLDGYLNMNGGDTLITESNKTWTEIASQGIRKKGWYQVFAPNQNENVYTNNWTGPFYGFERVIETFKLTEEPVRFKPVDIYFHFYAGTKPATLGALQKIHGWAVAQPFTRLYSSQYIRKVLDFENTSYARSIDGGDLVIRTGKHLRTLRLPLGAATPSLTASTGVAGVAPGPAGAYLITSAGEVRVSSQPQAKPILALYEASGAVSNFSRTETAGGSSLSFTLSANGAASFSVSNSNKCSATADGKALMRSAGNKNSIASSKYAAQSAAHLAITQYEIRTSPNNFATTEYNVRVQCAA